MAESETRTGQPDPDGRQPSGLGVQPSYEPTVTFLPGSTPGPASRDRSTDSDATERLALAPETKPHPALPDIPGYQLLAVLGRGGMGTVYQAVDRGLNRVVALKLIHAGSRDELAIRVRFEREVQSLARIEHRNIVRVYIAGYWQGFPFYTMKYVPGGTLARHLDRVRADLAGAVRLVAKVARAVHWLHQAGVLHRDLKPPNILLDTNDEPLVADFGLAKWLNDDTDLTESGAPLGTRHYMAPEQTLGSKAEYGPACDVWGIGVILYEVLAGRRPYIAEDPIELYREIREQPPPPCAEFNPSVPPGVEAIVRKCLAKDPAARYATAEAVAEDLERWLAGEAITLPLDTPPVRSRPARSLRWVWAGVAAVMLLTAGVVYALRPWERIPPPVDVTPPVQRTIAERLRAGETVELLGNTGMPLEPHTAVDNRPGLFKPGPDGSTVFAATSYGMAEFVNEDLPPVLIQFEVAIVPNPDNPPAPERSGGFGGFYVARKTWAGPNGPPHTSMVWLRFQSRSQLHLMKLLRPIREDVSLEMNWRGQRGAGLTVGWWRGGYLVPLQEPPPLRWHRVEMNITPQTIHVKWDGLPLQPGIPRRPHADVAELDVLKYVNRMARETWPGAPADYISPAFGPGIGVCAQHCEIAFKNVKLIPVR